ncbi:hypothetical protein BDW75DRAFT_223754 [Aspergillus navahoensis]
MSSPPVGSSEYIATVLAALYSLSSQFLHFPQSPSRILHSLGRDAVSPTPKIPAPLAPLFLVGNCGCALFPYHLHFQILCPVSLHLPASRQLAGSQLTQPGIETTLCTAAKSLRPKRLNQ